MIKRIIINIYIIINYLFLVLYSKQNLFETNLSRLSNTSKKDYFLLLIILLLIGISIFFTLRKIGYQKYAPLGLISLVIGSIVPYNYLLESSLSCTLHTLLAYVSFVLVFMIIILISFKLMLHNKKLFEMMLFLFMVICAICIYEYGQYLFVNTMMELLYIGYLIILEIVIINLKV